MQTMQNNDTKSKNRKNSNSSAASSTAPLTHEQITARAFQIYVRNGRKEGRDTENWLEAEAELRAEARNGKTA